VTIKNDIDFSPDTLLHFSFSSTFKVDDCLSNFPIKIEVEKRSNVVRIAASTFVPYVFMNKARSIKKLPLTAKKKKEPFDHFLKMRLWKYHLDPLLLRSCC